ncbi:MAG: hypothetical protein JW834_00865, partial [Candidatus Diapherotrites archaeon]|nr:hypothetical protein [Candidatus Diapherotrites archaeon]
MITLPASNGTSQNADFAFNVTTSIDANCSMNVTTDPTVNGYDAWYSTDNVTHEATISLGSYTEGSLYYIHVNCTGNSTAADWNITNITFWKDTTPPSVGYPYINSTQVNYSGWVPGTISLKAQVNDTTSPISTATCLFFNSALNVSGSWEDGTDAYNGFCFALNQILTNGTAYMFYFSVNDSSIPVSSQGVGGSVSWVADTQHPNTTSSETGGWHTAAYNVTLTCADTSSGCAATNYSMDGGAWSALNEYNVTISTEGNHTILFNSTDNVGNVEPSNTIWAALDTSDPVVTLVTVDNYNVTDTTPTLQFNFTDTGINITSCVLYVNGQSNATNATTLNATTTNLTTSVLGDGAHTWYVNCTDDAGNVGNSSSYNLTVDTTGPLFVEVYPSSPLAQGGTYNISYTIYDGLEANYMIYRNDTQVGTVGSFANAVLFNISVNTTGVGTWNYSIVANDSVSNANSTYSLLVVTDQSAPSVTLITPDYYNFSNSTPTLEFNFTDNVDLTTSCVLYVNGQSNATNATTLNATTT